MTEPVRLVIEGPVARIVVDRPEARNAMSFAMYDLLEAAVAEVRAAAGVRALVISGTEKAFIAGTDISEFLAFRGGEDGLAYEARVETVVAAVESLPIPTIAAIRGVAAGGGLVLAAVCDLRLMERGAKIGVPIARTVGNCLSSRNLRRLERTLGPGPVRRMLFASELLDAAACSAAGFASWVVEAEAFEGELQKRLEAVTGGAPLTLAASKQALRRLADGQLDDADLIAQIYGSADFAEGVAAFVGKRPPVWRGR
jgi:enoyl-CoA hydratase/carnithine racemase